jgi:UDP-N-acetylmuramoyl-tripeptide--D-alanyl-D-alanine ligase
VGKDILALVDALGSRRVTATGAKVGDIVATVVDGLAYGDAVMVKGSNGVGLAALVKAIRDRFGT